MNTAPIDILLAVYNGAEFLPAFLDSLLAQSCRDFRLVVSDNRSTDATAAILETYRPKFEHAPLFLAPPEQTVSVDRNFARVTDAGAAPYLMYADGDDVWHSDKVEKTLAAMKAAERRYGSAAPIMIHSNLAVVDRDLKTLHPSYWRYHFVDPRRTRLNQLLVQNAVTGCTTMLNKPLLDLGKPLPPKVFVHDHWYALVASAFGHIEAIDEALIEYRQHDKNITGAKRWGLEFILRRARQLFSVEGPRMGLSRSVDQAGAFLDRFADRLSPTQRRTVEAFATITQHNAFMRRWCLIRYGFWKLGFIRNAGLFLAI